MRSDYALQSPAAGNCAQTPIISNKGLEGYPSRKDLEISIVRVPTYYCKTPTFITAAMAVWLSERNGRIEGWMDGWVAWTLCCTLALLHTRHPVPSLDSQSLSLSVSP
jgi:hypothetical protein